MIDKRFLTLRDVNFIEVNSSCSPFECLRQISKVAEKKLEEENLIKKTSMAEEANPGPGPGVEEYLKIKIQTFIAKEDMEAKMKIENFEKTIEKLLKKPVIDEPVDNSPKEERMKREKRLKRPVTEEKPKNKKRYESEESEDQEKPNPIKKKKMSSNTGIDNVSYPPPELPSEFKEKINNLNGSKLKLLIQKKVTATDVSHTHNRISMPLNGIKVDFLSDEEKKHLDSHTGTNVAEIPAKLIQPGSCKECDVTFKKWDMKKERGKTSSMYVFSKEWNEIKRRNGIEQGTMVQVWSFRGPGDELCFALVIVEEGGDGNRRSSASQSGEKNTPSTSQSHHQED
ncbi:B3 domain-containing protein At5g24050-like [Camellia sinensis]|uniref:TF-B3 domain-containing protein n=1 Tax=Camellia sinensis var. sinensis TaxID=542762 RepID=A0A4S4D216_CAMSN|nr:B3 domain-containing protein At5g24050-like [Camellia sinensis]THF96107.1 hypothetical protein TEA_007495 [Camellia sinensis var. sinensis]